MVTLGYLAFEIFHQQERFFETEGQNNQLNSFTFTTCFVEHINHWFKGKGNSGQLFLSALSTRSSSQHLSKGNEKMKFNHPFLVPVLILKKTHVCPNILKQESIFLHTLLYLKRIKDLLFVSVTSISWDSVFIRTC